MMEHPNARLIRHCYEAFATGDLESLREFMAHDVVWHEPGRGPFAGDHKEPKGVLSLLRELQERSDNSFSLEMVDLLVNAERAVAIQEETARRGDRQLDMASAIEFEIHQGKITEVTVYHGDTYHFDQFWS
ncbi:MAG: nuclear transport factor 2 family protein [Acidimicrobiia bacterium]|nr:nuclear transport factor 2 family protein [Acidimicrobiia bacterium]